MRRHRWDPTGTKDRPLGTRDESRVSKDHQASKPLGGELRPLSKTGRSFTQIVTGLSLGYTFLAYAPRPIIIRDPRISGRRT